MTEGLPPLANILSEMGDTALFVLRLAVALVGAVLGWYVSSPLAKGLYWFAVRRPLPGPALVMVRLGTAVGVGVLLFHFVTFGSGGGGTGGGRGSGKGPGSGGGDGKGKDGGQKDGKPPEVKKGEPGETIPVEIIVSKRYKHDQRWYLIESKPPPKTLDEVDQYLKEHQGKFKYMAIILYADSVEPGAYAVEVLKDLAEKHKLRSYLPKEYRNKEKPQTPE